MVKTGRKLLPPCEGPKLEPFRYPNKPIEFLDILSDPFAEVSSSSAIHSHVFRVRIHRTDFALKIFTFYSTTQGRQWLTTSWNDRVSDETLTFHADPFFAECRAYGRINEHQNKTRHKPLDRAQRKHKRGESYTHEEIAVPCYGYTYLPAEPYEEILRSRFGIRSWNRSEDDTRSSRNEQKPFRALVKKFVDSERSVVNPAKMLRDLKKLRSLGVFQRDVVARNYKDGLLVDFSVAWTEPFWKMQLMGEVALILETGKELFHFDKMIEESGVKTVVRASPNWAYRDMLRSNATCHDSDEDDETESD